MATDEKDWQAPQVIETANGPTGVIEMPKMDNPTPCIYCKHWCKGTHKLRQHVRAMGLVPDAQGRYQMPPSPELRGESIKIDFKYWGLCLALGIPTHMDAGIKCPTWAVVETRAEMARRIGEMK